MEAPPPRPPEPSNLPKETEPAMAMKIHAARLRAYQAAGVPCLGLLELLEDRIGFELSCTVCNIVIYDAEPTWRDGWFWLVFCEHLRPMKEPPPDHLYDLEFLAGE